MDWFNPQECNDIAVYGFNYFEEERKFQRFNSSDFSIVEQLPGRLSILGYNSAGGMLAFWGDIKALAVRIKLHYKSTMNHMCYTSQMGFDVYIGDSVETLAYLSTASFDGSLMEYEAIIKEELNFGKKLYVINLPLYASVDSLMVGVEGKIEPAKIFNKGKIVYYGTSITQGASASRPGLCYTSILARRLNYQSLNYGFSGNGLGQPEIATILAAIKDVDLFVLDYAANVTVNQEKATMDNMINTIRNNYPNVPIIIMGKQLQVKEYHYADFRKKEQQRRNFERKIIRKRQSLGDHNIYYLPAKAIGITLEETIDGVHLTDMGFNMIANKLEKMIRKILNNI